jgi:hypothetical protein
MTCGAAVLWFRTAGQVLGMIEFDVECLLKFLGERFHRRRYAANTGVTNRAHSNIRRGELREMATGAVFMTRKTRLRSVVIAAMTTGASNRRMTLTRVQEF